MHTQRKRWELSLHITPGSRDLKSAQGSFELAVVFISYIVQALMQASC